MRAIEHGAFAARFGARFEGLEDDLGIARTRRQASGRLDPAQSLMRERTRLEKAVGGYGAVERELDDTLELIELAEAEGDEAMLDEAQGALKELRDAQARGVMAHAETCPQYLLLDVTAYDQPGFDGAKYVLTPPLREEWNQDELWRALRGSLSAS